MTHFANRYQIQTELGRGSFGTVHLAIDTKLGDRQVALKVLHPALNADPATLALFEKEAGLLARLGNHDNIVSVHAADVWQNQRYIDMQYVDGSSLADLVKESGAQPPHQVREWLRQAAVALAFAHQEGILHRDIKTANLLLDTDRNRVLMTDFGLALAVENSGGSSSHKSTHAMTGTAAYRAPEVVDTGHTEASDLYGLGVVGYELLAGRLPFVSDDPLSMMMLHASRPVPDLPPECPADLRAVVMKLLEKEPQNRHVSAAALRVALERREPEPFLHKSEPKRGPSRWLNAVLGLVLLLLCIAFWLTPLGRAILPGATDTPSQPLVAQIATPAVEQAPLANEIETPRPTVVPTETPNAEATTAAEEARIQAGVETASAQTAEARPTSTPTPQPTSMPRPTNTSTPNVGATATAVQNVFATSVAATLTALPTSTPTQTPTPAEPAAGSTHTIGGITFVYVPEGEFLMGSSDADENADIDEKPQHRVYLDGYWIMKTEITNAAYARCVDAGTCTEPSSDEWNQSNYAEHPVNKVNWTQADSYCRWVGGRLPTEAEWEKAARGTDGRIYPWGNEWDGSRLNYCDVKCADEFDFSWADKSANDGYGRTAPVGSYPQGASSYGALDMVGNVWEWVQDGYDADYYEVSPPANPDGPATSSARVLRGGSFGDVPSYVRAAFRHWFDPTSRVENSGFRCVSPGF